MKKLNQSGVPVLLSLLLVSFWGLSCVNEEYDMSGDNLNLEVTPFQEGITIPLMNINNVTVADLFGDVVETSGILNEKEDGMYVLEYSGSFNRDQKYLPSFEGLSNIPNLDFSHVLDLDMNDAEIPGIMTAASAMDLTIDNIEVYVDERFDVDVVVSENIPMEMKHLGMVYLDDAYVDVTLDASSVLPALGSAELSFDFEVTLPEMIMLAGNESGVVKLSGKAGDNGMVELDPIKVEALDIDKDRRSLEAGLKDILAVRGTVMLDNVSIDSFELLKDNISLRLNVSLKNRDTNQKNINVSKLTAKVDYRLEPIVQTVDLSDLTEFFGDAVFDLNHAEFILEIATNLGIRTLADIKIIPYGSEADEVSEHMVLKVSESANTQIVTEYTFYEKEILDIIRDLPEKLEFRADVYTDEHEYSVIEPQATYYLNVGYRLEAPLEFGDEFKFTYNETVEAPELILSLLSEGCRVGITGEIENTIPLGFDFQMNFLNASGTVIQKGKTQKISPCSQKDIASKTALNIELALDNGVEVEDISSLELVLNAESGVVSGIPFNANQYMNAEIQLNLPEGVTIDLNEIMNDDE